MIITEATPPYKEKPHLHFDAPLFEEHVESHASAAISQFKEITRHYALFHIAFFAIGCLELLAFVLFFSFLTRSTILAFSLAGIFLTGFAYFVLLFYFQAKKPDQLLELRRTFIEECQSSLPFEKGMKEYHLSLSHALYRFIGHLHRQEYSYYALPESFKTLAPLMKKFSVWCHWKDLHQMKEILLLLVVKENIELIKIAPTDLEHHAGLASSYLTLSRHYQDPRKTDPEAEHPWVAPDYTAPAMVDKFKRSAWRAIEEFKILDSYAPNDPWIHAQLAAVYHDLELPEEEIRQYETILKTSPHEKEVLFRLGVLYFSQGHNAQALRLYEQLKTAKDSKAAELLSYYGAYMIDDYPVTT